MKNIFLVFFFVLFGLKLKCQVNTNKYIGINLIQGLSTTINGNLTIDCNQYFTPLIDLGYTFNYEKSILIPQPTYKIYDGYSSEKT